MPPPTAPGDAASSPDDASPSSPTLGQRLELFVFRAAIGFFAVLPRRLALRVGVLLGDLFYLLDRRDRRIALHNLGIAFPDRTPAEHRALLRASVRNLGRTAAEICHLASLTPDTVREYVTIEDPARWQAALDRAHERGTVILTGHFGNWEVSTTAGLALFPEMRGKFHFVRRPIKPAWLDRLVTRRFEKAGFGVFSKRDSLDAMLACLAQGDAVVLPFDQHAGPPDGIAVDFLGHPAWTFKSLAIIALSTGAPVLPASSWREPDGRHVLRFEAPIPAVEHASTNEAIRLTTGAYNAELERLVLRRPEQWYWVHRRWKEVTPGARKRKRLRTADAARGSA